MPARQPVNTTAQSEAAEVRTVAELLDRGLVAGQYPRNFPLADVYAFDAQRRSVVNIQVKYRHGATGTEIAALTREVQDKVCERFGVALEPVPAIV
jgi:hypothetical protein